MSSCITYICDFCGNSIVDGATKNGCQGFCIYTDFSGKKGFTIYLDRNIKGKHICTKCINEIIDYCNSSGEYR